MALFGPGDDFDHLMKKLLTSSEKLDSLIDEVKGLVQDVRTRGLTITLSIPPKN